MPTLSRPAFPVGFEPKINPTADAPYDELPWTNEYWCQTQGFTTVGQGLASSFEEGIWSQFTAAQKEKFSPERVEEARVFLLEVQTRWRENPGTYTMGLVKVPGFKAFRDAMKALIDRNGGMHDTIWEAMVAKHATPMDAVRDMRIKAVSSIHKSHYGTESIICFI
jgi:hypothetical protein